MVDTLEKNATKMANLIKTGAEEEIRTPGVCIPTYKVGPIDH